MIPEGALQGRVGWGSPKIPFIRHSFNGTVPNLLAGICDDS